VKALIDSDVLLDVAMARQPFEADSVAVLDWCERHAGNGAVAWHTIANIHYVMRKNGGGEAARELIRDLIEFVDVVATGTADVRHALQSSMADFEDAMQAAAAVVAGADYIVTRNITDFLHSPIPAILPADFLAVAPA
jgi:predicted nucleic acid-binding protein